MRHFIVGFITLCLVYIGLIGVAIATPSLLDIKQGKIQEIIEPDIIILKGNNTKIRLSGIYVPKYMQEKAQNKLKELFLKQEVYLDNVTNEYDRYGYLLSQVKRQSDNLWAQSLLLKEGLAYVLPNKKVDSQVIKDLYAAETYARDIGAGLWAEKKYKVKSPETIEAYYNSWQLIEGEIKDVTRKSKYTYLNFGEDWKTDFTVRIRSRDVKALEKGLGFEIKKMVGSRIRVRGWVEKYNGAMMTLDHLYFMEVI